MSDKKNESKDLKDIQDKLDEIKAEIEKKENEFQDFLDKTYIQEEIKKEDINTSNKVNKSNQFKEKIKSIKDKVINFIKDKSSKIVVFSKKIKDKVKSFISSKKKNTTIKEPKIEKPNPLKNNKLIDVIKNKKNSFVSFLSKSKHIEWIKRKHEVRKNTPRPQSTPKQTLIAKIVWVFTGFFLVGVICSLGFFIYLLQGKPEFDANKLKSDNSTIIYDANGNEIIELGLYLRENVEYEDIPTSLIDAFLSIEDNRYFTHIGFDIPRFTRVALKGLGSGEFSQGGSTITMQLIKNSYFQIDNDTDSTMAARKGFEGLSRKAQEIVLAIQANTALSKKDIITLFLNKINFGNNIRGVQKAAQYYFGKDVSDLNLAESAFLAGIINGPNSYNPYNELYKSSTGDSNVSNEIEYLVNAQTRKNEVLSAMERNGYISKTECELAQSIKIEDLLSGISDKFQNYRQYYQSYIDAVIDETIKVTGKDPYSTSMSIYTNMDPHMQEYVYNIQNQNIEGLEYTSPNEQSAIVLMNNQNGSIIALGGGTNQNEARQFNRATSAYIQPGSSIKTVLEYALAFDQLGWATSHTVCDKPIYLYGSDILIVNAGGQDYTGDMLITEAIARSLNTPAIQTLEEVIKKKGEAYVVDYMNSIGFNVKAADFDLQFAIGGNKLTCTPVQLAGAHAMLMNYGKYITPHTIKTIKFAGDDEIYVADTEGKQVISPGAAWLTAYCEQYNVEGPFFNYMQKLQSDYPVFAKTGTTDWGSSGTSFGIPVGAIKDCWLVAQTNKYTMSIWLGFDKLEKGSYFTASEDATNLKGKIGRALLDELEDHFKYNPGEYKMPNDVTEITHVRGAYPYAEGGWYSTVTGFVTKDNAKLVDISTLTRENKVGEFAGMKANKTEDGQINIYWAGFGYYSDGVQDLSAVSLSGKVTPAVGRCYFPRYNYVNPETFFGEIRVGGSPVAQFQSNNPSYRYPYNPDWGDAEVCGWTSSDSNVRCSQIE